MRIALVNPPQPYLVVPGQIEPLGLEYLEAAIIKHCPEWGVELIDAAAWSVNQTVEMLLEHVYDVIAYTSTTLDYATVRNIAVRVSLGCDGIRQIIGGPHATAIRLQPDDIWDEVFYGEAEETLPEYLNQHDAYINSRIREADCRADLDTYAWPIRHGNPKVLSVVGSRGCAMSCAFCGSRKLWPGKVRRRSVEDVRAEMVSLHDRYPDALISLFDEDLGSNEAWLLKLCDRLLGTGIRWKAQMRVDRADYPALAKMMYAGCVEVDFGIESFDQRVLDALDKHVKVERNFKAVEMAHNACLPSRLYMMIGTPGQVYKETVQKNIDALESLKGKFSVVNVCPFTPLPGTPIADDPAKYGITILDDDVSKYHRYSYRRDADGEVCRPVWSPIDVDGMTHDELLEDMRVMYEYFDTLEEANKGRRATCERD